MSPDGPTQSPAESAKNRFVTRPGWTEDFTAEYANNVNFELGTWDLKIIFGQNDQSTGDPRVEWHTAMTMPWPVAKLMHYLLGLNLWLYEANSGQQIQIPVSGLPPYPAAPTGDMDIETNRAFYEFMKKTYPGPAPTAPPPAPTPEG
jgi:hypothetical protein